MEYYLHLLLQILSVLSVFVFNYLLLSYYTDPNEQVKVTMAIQVFALSSVLVYILLIAFDVFTTVRHKEILFKLHFLFGYTIKIRIYDLYFISYMLMIYFCFIGLPFSYFYA